MKIQCHLLVGLLLIGFLFPFMPQRASAQDSGTIVTPGEVMEGTLDEDNPDDYYGLVMNSGGDFNFSVFSYGDALVEAALRVYIQGIPYDVVTIIGNSSTIVPTEPVSAPGSSAQIYVRSLDDQEVVSYIVEFKHVNPRTVVGPDTAKDIELESDETYWYIFEATSSTNAYNFTILKNTTAYIEWYIYDEDGIRVIYDLTHSNESFVILLERGQYYINIQEEDGVPQRVRTWFFTLPIPIVEPGDTINLHLDDASSGIQSQYYQLSLEEGMYYQMFLTTEDTADGGFTINHGPSTARDTLPFNTFSTYGMPENVTDLILYGQHVAYSAWDTDLSGHWEKTYFYRSDSESSIALNHSSLILGIHCYGGEGDATFSIDSGTPVSTISPTQSAIRDFNNTIGPHWFLFRVTDLSTLSLYEFHFNHSALAGDNISTSIRVYTPQTSWIDYMYMMRHSMDPDAIDDYDENLYLTIWTDWDDYDLNTNRTEWYYQHKEGDRWLLVYVPDKVYIGTSLGGIPMMRGTVDISIVELAHIDYTVGVVETIDPDPDRPILLRTVLEGGHTYRVSVKAENLSSYGWAELYNASGWFIAGWDTSMTYSPWASEVDTWYSVFYIQETMDIAALLYSWGDAPIEFLIYDTINDLAGQYVDLLIVVLGLVGVGVVVLVIGIQIGRSRC